MQEGKNQTLIVLPSHVVNYSQISGPPEQHNPPTLLPHSEGRSIVSDYIVHGIFQARILEWVAFPFSRGSSQPRD